MVPKMYATIMETAVVRTKTIGMIHNSRSFAEVGRAFSKSRFVEQVQYSPGERKNATFENSRHGVNSDTLRRFSF